MNETTLRHAERAVKLLNENKMTVSSAESCTGGLLSAYITSVAGASAVFELGVVSYSVRIKHEVLGVSEKTLEAFGAVSRETAREMAEGVRKKASSDIGLSVTGVAGPDPSEGHEPGLVYIAATSSAGTEVKELHIVYESRSQVRETAVSELFSLLLKTIGEVKK